MRIVDHTPGAVARGESGDAPQSDLARALQWQEAIFEGSRDAIFISDKDARFIGVNRAACDLTGYSRDELLRLTIPDLHEAVDLEAYHNYHDLIMSGQGALTEAVLRKKDGSRVATEFSNVRVVIGGTPYMHTTARDLTGRRRAEEAQQESSRALEALVKASPLAIIAIDADATVTMWNPAAERLFGWSAAEVLGKPLPTVPSGEEESFAALRVEQARGAPQTAREVRRQRKDGSVVDVGLWTVPLRDASGKIATTVGLLTDVTEERRLRMMQAALYEISEATQVTENLDELFCSIHASIGRLMEARNFYIALYDPSHDLLSFPYFVDEKDQRPQPFPLGRGMTSYVLRSGKPLLATPESLAVLEENGEIESLGTPSVDWLGVPLRLRDKTVGVLAVQSYSGSVRYTETEKGILTYVSTQVAHAIEHKRADEALRESEQRFHSAFEDAAIGMALVGLDGRWLRVNRALCDVVGYSEAELLSTTFQDITYSEDLDADLGHVSDMLAGRFGTYQMEKRYVHKQGHLVWVLLSVSLVRDTDGQPHYFISQIQDMSQLKLAEEELLQAQKMEAIGSLAGGVAHDFNNLLQAMLSQTELVRSSLTEPTRVATGVGELEQQIRRGAALARQLLLFSRREAAKPEWLDLNEVVKGARQFLGRLVRDDITFTLGLAEGLLAVLADRGKLDQVLMNLVVNACDAMPEGGRLTIRTGRGEQGSVWLSVEDTGAGISQEIRDRIFEPFFTTKMEKGSGLGLSVVHGIVSQHGGTIQVSDREGGGSVFRIELPAARLEERRAASIPRAAGEEVPHGGGERVLVVEDEAGAREGLVDLLGMLGYQVTGVASAEDAGRLANEPPFDLLLTDVLLPGASGSDLARGLQARWRRLKVILMSGYTEDEAVRRGVGGGWVRFLQKPFDMKTLAQEVDTALHRDP